MENHHIDMLLRVLPNPKKLQRCSPTGSLAKSKFQRTPKESPSGIAGKRKTKENKTSGLKYLLSRFDSSSSGSSSSKNKN